MKRLGLTRLHLPDVVLFLDVDPAVSLARIEKRGEKVQAHETAEKLERLRGAYHMAVEAARAPMGLPAFVVDGAREVDAVTAESCRLVREAAAAPPQREEVRS
jgi:thymidylate kinase